MKQQRFPDGWDAERFKRLIDELHALSDEECIAADEAAAGGGGDEVVIIVPARLAPEVRRLVAIHKSALCTVATSLLDAGGLRPSRFQRDRAEDCLSRGFNRLARRLALPMEAEGRGPRGLSGLARRLALQMESFLEDRLPRTFHDLFDLAVLMRAGLGAMLQWYRPTMARAGHGNPVLLRSREWFAAYLRPRGVRRRS